MVDKEDTVVIENTRVFLEYKERSRTLMNFRNCREFRKLHALFENTGFFSLTLDDSMKVEFFSNSFECSRINV
jgi:hypothetical protein